MEENTVRLVEGRGNNTGFVELNLLGQWVPICGQYSWNILDASVVCRELGYLTAVSALVNARYHYQYRYFRRFTTYTYSCTGNESTLKQCRTSYERSCNYYYYTSRYYYYYYYYAAFVNCSGEFIQICNAL